MTSEEIKKTITMPDLLSRYGIEVKHNMCRCAFHGEDRHPSMKVFKDGANCFTCGWNGDIFKFVMDMENCSFKDAFIRLGGHYEHETNQKRKVLGIKYKREKEKREKKAQFQQDFKLLLSRAITRCRQIIEEAEPLSDEWCEAQKELEKLLYAWETEYIEKESVNKADVIRMCKRVERIGHPIGRSVI